MIDLITTRADVDEVTRRNGLLLIAVINQAVLDLAVKPLEQEQHKQINLWRDAVESLLFFFDKSSPFEGYCSLLGINPDQFRDALSDIQQQDVNYPLIKAAGVRAIRKRIEWWKKSPLMQEIAAELITE